MRNTNDWKEKLQAFCEGLEMENIQKLMTGSVGDFRLIGKVMAQRIKDVKSGMPLTAVANGTSNQEPQVEGNPEYQTDGIMEPGYFSNAWEAEKKLREKASEKDD